MSVSKQIENWQFWQKWEYIWISVWWDLCLNPILNPSSNTVLSLRRFIVHRKTSNMINKLHKRTLRLNYNDYEFTFEDLLAKDWFFTIHCYTIQTFAIELIKCIMIYPKQFWGNCLQEIIAIICIQNLALIFCRLGLYRKDQSQSNILVQLSGT